MNRPAPGGRARGGRASRSARLALGAVVAVAGLSGVSGAEAAGAGAGAAPAAARALDPAYCDPTEVDQVVPADPTRPPGAPFRQLMLDEAHRASTGAGVGVAVIDTGVRPTAVLTPVRSVVLRGAPGVVEGHGTIVAGLVAGRGRVGWAPGARVVSVKVTDAGEPSSDQVGPGTDGVVAGLRWVAANARRLGIGVVNVSLRVSPAPELAAAVRAVQAEDVVVVAAAGNRDDEGGEPEESPAPDEDAAVYPADYPGVLGVTTTVGRDEDAAQVVLRNRETDLAVPTLGAVSVMANGQLCTIGAPATSWAAAEVSGLVALVRARRPRDNAAQVMARVIETADGRPGMRSAWTGAGTAQPVEALTRELSPDAAGRMPDADPGSKVRPRYAEPPPPDLLAGLRRDYVVWGLLGGSVLLLALLLRPLLGSRRRRRSP